MGIIARLRSSLTYPIAATLVLVTVVPMVAVGLLLTNSSRIHLETMENLNLGRLAVGLGSETALFYDGHRTQLASAALALAAADNIDADGFGTLLEGMASEPGRAFVYLQINPNRGTGAFAMAPSLGEKTIERIDESIRQAHERTVRGEIVENVLLDMPRNQPPMAVMAFPLRSRTGEIWGSLAGILDLAPLEAEYGRPHVRRFSGEPDRRARKGGRLVEPDPSPQRPF